MVQSNNKRIVHLVVSLNPGGTEIYLSRLLPKLQEYYDNSIICLWGEGSVGKILIKQGLRVNYLSRNIFELPALPWRLWQLLRQIKPDALFTYLIHANLVGRMIGRLAGVRSIVCNERGSLERWQWLRIFDRWSKGLVTKYTVQTKSARITLSHELDIPREQIWLTPNVVFSPNIENLTPRNLIRQQFGLKHDHKIIICVAGLRPVKGHEYLIRAFGACHNKFPLTTLVLAGDGPTRSHLEKLTQETTEPNAIKFLGHQPSDITQSLLRGSDIFVLPSIDEGMSNSLLEAMLAKIPIVATNVKANSELLDDSCALLVPIRSAEAIELALIKILSDTPFAEKLANKAHEKCQKNTSPSQTIELINSVLKIN